MSYQSNLKGHLATSAFSVNPGSRVVLDPTILSPGESRDGNVTLVVVDMQPRYREAIDTATLDAVERQIKLAISRNWAIVVLENEPWRNGPTYRQLMRHLKDERDNWIYKRAFMRVKATDSGAEQVIEACLDFDYPMQYFRVCGVLLDACVKQTVLGILARVRTASIRCIAEAMNTDYDHKGAWEDFPTRPYLVVSSERIDSASDKSAQPTNAADQVPMSALVAAAAVTGGFYERL